MCNVQLLQSSTPFLGHHVKSFLKRWQPNMAAEILSPEQTLKLCQIQDSNIKQINVWNGFKMSSNNSDTFCVQSKHFPDSDFQVIMDSFWKGQTELLSIGDIKQKALISWWTYQDRVKLRDQTLWFENSLAGPALAVWWNRRECPSNLCRSSRKKMWLRYKAPPVMGSPMLSQHRYALSYEEVGRWAFGRSDGKQYISLTGEQVMHSKVQTESVDKKLQLLALVLLGLFLLFCHINATQ